MTLHSNYKEHGRIWLITDTHLGHDKMVEYCGRPANHSDIIMKNLDEMIDFQDTVIHLGDVCIGDDEKWNTDVTTQAIKNILIRGNHDKKSNDWYLRHGWDFVCDSFSGHYFNKFITFSHEPIPRIQNLNIHGHFHNNLPRLLRKEWVVPGEEERNKILENYNPNLHKLLAIENTDYKPVLLKTFIAKL